MARMWFNSENCNGATSGVTGREYSADKQGFINVTDPRDVAAFKDAGYQLAGGMPRLSTYWECECGWTAAINSCPKCGREDLTKITK